MEPFGASTKRNVGGGGLVADCDVWRLAPGTFTDMGGLWKKKKLVSDLKAQYNWYSREFFAKINVRHLRHCIIAGPENCKSNWVRAEVMLNVSGQIRTQNSELTTFLQSCSCQFWSVRNRGKIDGWWCIMQLYGCIFQRGKLELSFAFLKFLLQKLIYLY